MKIRYFFILLLLLCFFSNISFAYEKHPNYAEMYLGKDKFENFNRKTFLFNGALNKFAIKPVTVVWSSIMPKYGMDRLKCAYQNILYPRVLVSSLIQKDLKSAGRATTRFLVNSTFGVAGLFDVSKKFLKIKPVEEDMDQALAKLKVKKGPYLVLPILSSTTVRGAFGKALDASLDPTSYIGSPVIAGVKAGLTVNNLTLSQPLFNLVEKNYIDPYDIAKKMYGIKVAIMEANLDRDENIQFKNNDFNEDVIENLANKDGFIDVGFNLNEIIKGSTYEDNLLIEELIPDIILKNYNSQHPVIDSMRTALFDIEGVDESIWAENSIWNRCFKNRIKTSSVEINPEREKYKFRYIMQKDKNSPVAIIFPSIGEGINSHHSNIMAKIFYDEGYSVIIQGSAFHYDFVKSMPKNYTPGNPTVDVRYIKDTTKKIVEKLENKYECKFRDKVVLGTSYGAMSSLFLADYEAKNNSLNISKFISINPPIELLYAMNVIDENCENWNKNPNNLKEKVAITTAKVLNATENFSENKEKITTLPFNLDEAKLITSFVLHQKLSDLIFALQENPIHKKTNFYDEIYKMNYFDYAKKYLISKDYPSISDYSNVASLHFIKDYLKEKNNYRIYHTLDDYLVNLEQLKKLKNYAKDKMTLIDKGSHLGFLYREEFIDDLRKEISIKEKARL